MNDFRIIVADDHPIFRMGLCNVIRTEFPGCQVFEADNGRQAWEVFEREKPDVVILDINMPQTDGLETCRKITEAAPATKVIILTMYKEKTLLMKARAYGAKSYLIKDNSIFEVVDSIRAVRNNRFYWSESLHELQTEIEDATKETARIQTQLLELSATELKTLKLVCKNYTSKEIADFLFVTPKSVDNYRSRICKKIGIDQGVHNSLLLWALKHKELIDSM
ncbi:MAG: response regulator transcription factor [Bacteroidetes bacterium]|nr:response regulator transcription factor [Bacteroidota bacterium]